MKVNQHPDESYAPWRRRLYEIIFEADTKAGKFFDVALLILIVKSDRRKAVTTRVCASCLTEGHDNDAKFCKYCSHELN